jgi:hypothetical protein
MTTLTLWTRFLCLGLMSACGAFFCPVATGQATPPQANSIAVKLGIEKAQVVIGQSPWAILTVKNLSNQEIPIHDWMYRVRVDGDNGEAPTT